METVTLSWSAKNIVTITLMNFAVGAAFVLAAKIIENVKARNGAREAA